MADDAERGASFSTRKPLQNISGKIFQRKYLFLIFITVVYLIYSENISLNLIVSNYTQILTSDHSQPHVRVSLMNLTKFFSVNNKKPSFLNDHSDKNDNLNSEKGLDSEATNISLLDSIFHHSDFPTTGISQLLILEDSDIGISDPSKIKSSLVSEESAKYIVNTSLINKVRSETEFIVTSTLLNGNNTFSYATQSTSSASDLTIVDVTNKSENSNITYPKSYKTIVFYTNFYGGSWSAYLRNGRTDLNYHGCQVTQCVFSFDPAAASKADAVIFHETGFSPNDVPDTRDPHQRYIWMNVEAPCPEERDRFDTRHGEPNFFNWTATYHGASEITMPYGGLTPLGEEKLPSRLFPLDRNNSAYKTYMHELEKGTSALSQINGTHLPEGSKLNAFFKRPQLVAWMVSHCETASGREIYVKELKKYIPVDVYGHCGNFICGKNHLDIYCYTDVLQPNYKFYLAFENSWCNDYITEKVWNPMLYGLVPVVYGGSKYDDYLPPNSYLDATKMSPKELAHKMKSIAASEEEYSKYHLWRKFWRVLVPGPMCDICERLHNDVKESSIANLWNWWTNVNNCTRKYPKRMNSFSFATSLIQNLGKGFELFNSFFDGSKNKDHMLKKG